jgi:hypothetical protein
MFLNSQIEEFFKSKQAHDEVGAAFTDSLKKLGKYQLLGNLQRFEAPYAVAFNVIFGGATDMCHVHYFLDPEHLQIALKSGAEASPISKEWIRFTLFRSEWPKVDLQFWSLKAYDAARGMSHP